MRHPVQTFQKATLLEGIRRETWSGPPKSESQGSSMPNSFFFMKAFYLILSRLVGPIMILFQFFD
jgi:hypothetical protein